MNNKLNIDKLDTFQPKCQILAKHLIEEMTSGIYMPGQKIASIRKVAEQYGVGRQIVLSAFELLAKRNYIYTEVGRGSFVNPDLKTGKFYRLGFFVNRINIAKEGLAIHSLHLAAQKHGYTLIPGSNFETELSFADWIESVKQLDGVVLTGMIDAAFLENVQKANIPYVVVGNYNISESYPQVIIDIESRFINSFSPILMKSNPKCCAAVFGNITFRAHREFKESFKKALSDAGIKIRPELICCASDNGYRTAVFLHESAEVKPDLIYIHEEQARGFQKYYNTHGCEQRPQIAINATASSFLDKKYYDYTVKNTINWKSVCSKAIKLLIKQSLKT